MPRRARKDLWLAVGAAGGFVLCLVIAAVLGVLPSAVPACYIVASGLSTATYWRDKSAARRGAWRTPEATLHLLDLAGGWPGGLIAQRAFRHKTRKPSFQLVFWILVVVNCAALGWLLSDDGAGVRSLLDAWDFRRMADLLLEAGRRGAGWIMSAERAWILISSLP